MKDYGLQAMECYHSDQTPADTRKYLQMAGRLGLFATGGSDYHGAVHPDIELGRGKGRLNMPDSLLQPFIERKNYDNGGIDIAGASQTSRCRAG